MALSLAIVFPIVLLVVLLVVQASLWWYASQAALTAAREGVDAGRARTAKVDDGPARAADFLARTGELAELVRTYDGASDAETYRLAVSVKPYPVLPYFDRLEIVQKASGPRERFVPQGAP